MNALAVHKFEAALYGGADGGHSDGERLVELNAVEVINATVDFLSRNGKLTLQMHLPIEMESTTSRPWG